MVSWGGGMLHMTNCTTSMPKISCIPTETSSKQFFYTFMRAFVQDLPSDRYCVPVLYTQRRAELWMGHSSSQAEGSKDRLYFFILQILL